VLAAFSTIRASSKAARRYRTKSIASKVLFRDREGRQLCREGVEAMGRFSLQRAVYGGAKHEREGGEMGVTCPCHCMAGFSPMPSKRKQNFDPMGNDQGVKMALITHLEREIYIEIERRSNQVWPSFGLI
jgi:hypothetical protein